MATRILIRREFRSGTHVSWAHLLFGILVLACRARVSPAVDWATDVPRAIAAAKRTGELIMIVDLPTANTVGDPVSRANDAFLVGSVGSRRLAPILDRECIPVQRQVGVPPVVRGQKKNLDPPSPQACPITYFCAGDFKTGDIHASDLTVVHFVVGYVAADRLENEARWALEIHRRVHGEFDVDNEEDPQASSKWLRIAHRDAAGSDADISTIMTSVEILSDSATDFGAKAASDIRDVLQAVSLLCKQRFVRRLGNSSTTQPSDQQLRNVSTDCSLNLGHLTLALLPDVRLIDIQQHCYELLAEGHCYSVESPRIQTMDAYLTKCALHGQPVLCLVHQIPPRADNKLVPSARHQPFLDDPKVQRRLRGFEVVPMLQAELAGIQQRRGKPPIEITADGAVLFALFDKQGQLSGTVCSEEPVAVALAQRLSRLQ